MEDSFLSPPAKRPMHRVPGMLESNSQYASANGAASKRYKPPPPPLTVAAGHVLLRLVCHSSRIGGVIGKSGTIIKQLQQDTAAKIRVDESPPGVDERVIIVIASSTVNKKITLKAPKEGEEGSGVKDEETEVSAAQEAVIRVFERILDVVAETDGVSVAPGGVVSCRLLAESSQVGSVIGKGGKVIEKIRKDTGCKIRVLSSEKLPAFASPNDEMVENEIILSALRNSGKVAVMASEEDDTPTWLTDTGPFVVVTDPLDGSRNIDASIPTGTIFGIYNQLVELDHLPLEEKALLNSLQSGTRLVAAGYVLYSSATILCTSFGSGTHAFTLDHSTGDFILTHPSIKIPPRGQIYSVNDARYFDWPEGLRRYIDTVRQGKGKYPKKYSARYICSLVADFHRTLLYGGVAMNPRDHLRLVYEANPLSFLVEQAGGRGSDGKSRILSLQPVKLHQRLPLFLGSSEDVEELESYGNVQQKVNPGYEV